MIHKSLFTLRGKVLLLVIFALFQFLSCTKDKEKSSNSTVSSQKDYFEDKVKIKYASGFEVEYKGDYKVVRILNPYKNSNDTITYVLVQRGTEKPSGYKGAQFIEVPIKSFACVYTTHAAFTDILGANNIITGFASPEYIVNAEVKKRIKDKSITYIGQPDALNYEALLALNPDALMVAGITVSDINKYNTLMESGIGVIVNAEWRENDPLGRAEWFKLMALLLNKERVAEEKFAKIEEEYLRLKSLTRVIKDKPNVLTGMSFKDVWYVPGGKSFMSQILEDAGATFPWKNDSSTASAPLNFEAVYDKGLNTDFWINPESAESLNDLIKADPRYADFNAFKHKKVYNHYKKTDENGGSEYWESGLVNPHIILADLIKIFHPALLPDHQLYYYKQLQ